MKLQAIKRETTGTTAARAARAEHKLPGVIYKKGQDSIPVLMNHKEMQDIVRKQGRNAVFEVEIEGGETAQVIIKHISRAALSTEIYNIELQAIEKGQTLVVTVPINLVGAEKIVDGVTSQMLNDLEIETTATNIPDDITVEIHHLVAGDTLTVADLTVPAGVTVVSEPDAVVAVISAPRVEEELPEDGTEVPANSPEPEVG